MLGFAACAIAAVAVFVLLAPNVPTSTPTLPSATGYESLVTQALADDAVDATGTLQTVPFEERAGALLVITVIALCRAGMSTPRVAPIVRPGAAGPTLIG